MADQTQRLEIATVKAEIASDILSRFSNEAVGAAPIPTDSGAIPNLKQVIVEIQEDGAEKISFATTIYPTTAAGIAATTDGAIFLVKSAVAGEVYAVWQNVAEVATDTGKRALTAIAITAAMDAADASADEAAASAVAAEDSADLSAARVAPLLGPFAVAPTTRNDSSPLQEGDEYQNTIDHLRYSWSGAAWVALNSSAQSLEERLATPFVAGMGSDMAPFWQDHADAVSRPMRHKMRDIKSVLDYKFAGLPPVDPTGVVDSILAINASYAAAGETNSQLFFPDGDFRVTDTIKARTHTLFSQGARIMHYGFSDDKTVFEIPGDRPGKVHENVCIVAGIGQFETPATYSGRGIVVASREGNVNTFGAYNTSLIKPRVRFCAWGLIIRSFQQVVISPDISDCKTGMAIAGTSGSNESGVVNVFGGWIRNCNDYAAYIGDTRVLPVTTNNLNGTTINFHGTQFLGTVRATKVAALAFPHCHFENHGYGNGTALQIDSGCYNVFADDCYFGGYDYAVKCTAQVSGILSVKQPTVFGNRKCIVYFFQPPGRLYVDTPVYTGGTNHDKAPPFHFGMPQDTTPNIAPLFKYINWKGIGFNIEAGRQSGTSAVDIALGGAVRKETDGDYVNIGVPFNVGMGIYRTTPATAIAGTLDAAGTAGFKFTLTDPTQIKFFAASDVTSCSVGDSGAANNITTQVDYELGIVSLSTSFGSSPMAGTISQIAPTWVKRRSSGSFTTTNTTTVPVADTSVTASSHIELMPTNAAAATLTGGVKAVWADRNPGTGFTLKTADGTATGTTTATFSYEIRNA